MWSFLLLEVFGVRKNDLIHNLKYTFPKQDAKWTHTRRAVVFQGKFPTYASHLIKGFKTYP